MLLFPSPSPVCLRLETEAYAASQESEVRPLSKSPHNEEADGGTGKEKGEPYCNGDARLGRDSVMYKTILLILITHTHEETGLQPLIPSWCLSLRSGITARPSCTLVFQHHPPLPSHPLQKTLASSPPSLLLTHQVW